MCSNKTIMRSVNFKLFVTTAMTGFLALGCGKKTGSSNQASPETNQNSPITLRQVSHWFDQWTPKV